MQIPLSVPPPFRPAFEALAHMSEQAFAALGSSLLNAPMTGGLASLVSAVESGESDLSEAEAELLLGSLTAFVNMARSHGWSQDEVVDRLVVSQDLELEQAARDGLRPRLAELIGLKPVRMVAKLMILSWDHDRVFTDVRFLTDLRPIFTDDDHAETEGVMLVQMLRLEFATSDGTRDTISVALDRADMAYLKAAIERAEAKEVSVRQVLADGNIDYVGASE